MNRSCWKQANRKNLEERPVIKLLEMKHLKWLGLASRTDKERKLKQFGKSNAGRSEIKRKADQDQYSTEVGICKM